MIVETPNDAIARARKCLGQGCHYVLGAGGMHPEHEFPWHSPVDGCDCSGFVAWCLGRSRKTDDPWYRKLNGGWLETSAIVRDALSDFGAFTRVGEWKEGAFSGEARVGDLLVYGDAGGHQGHVGLVTGVDSMQPVKVIHCSLGNWHARADAIRETGIAPWEIHGGLCARYALFEEGGA